MNYKLRLDVPVDVTTLRNSDILEAVKYLINLKLGEGDCSVDDIDHLGNRRIRSVGELIENQYRIGLIRMERAIKEKMSLQDVETMMPHDLVNAKAGLGRRERVLRLEPALPVHGPDQPALRDHPQAKALGPGAGGPHARAGGLRGPRRPQQPLRPDLPRGNAGRAEHRSHRVAFDLCTGQRVRLHRDPLPSRGQRPRAQRHQVPHGHRGGEIHHRPGRRRPGQQGPLHGTAHLRPQGRRIRDRHPRGSGAHGRLPEPARLRGRRPHPLPGARRREPRAHGIQHATPGRPAAAPRGASHRHGHGEGRSQGFGRRRHGEAPGGGGERRCLAHRRQVRRGRARQLRHRCRHIQPDQIPAHQPGHLLQPASRHRVGQPGECGRHHRRRPCDPGRRARARPQRHGGLHVLGRLQLRGLHPGVRADREGGRLYLRSHRRVRDDGPRHEARQGGDHPRHPQRGRGGPAQPRRQRHCADGRLRETRRHPRRARSPPRARRRSPPRRSS